MTPRPPRSTLFPYTTLFRSGNVGRPVTTSQHSVERLFDPVRFQRKPKGVPEHHRGAEDRADGIGGVRSRQRRRGAVNGLEKRGGRTKAGRGNQPNRSN